VADASPVSAPLTTAAGAPGARDIDASPRGAHWVALLACAAAALLLLWPLLSGELLLGGRRSDMFIAGYSFRRFGAEMFKATGAIPQWNPFLFGGLPYIGAMHGDIFYPTAWLRWIMPVDLAITWGMAVHFVLAGWFTYRLARALGVTFGSALFAGICYELTGIVASQMSPGHDGKLFVSALTPLAFWTLLHAIRRDRRWAFGAFAFEVALIILGHYHMAYFLLLALGLWALYLALWDGERVGGRPAWMPLALAMLAVAIGASITALQVLPFLEYIPFSPRADGGPDTGWQFATSFAMPPSEIMTLLLPEFNGVLDRYWGSNPLKFHTEYMGVLPLTLAALALGSRDKRRLVLALALGALFFLLLAFAGHTPFYKPFYEWLPLVKKIRAMGMVFYLPAFGVCVLAGIGLDRVLAGEARLRAVLAVSGAVVAIALLGALGGLQGLAESLAIPERVDAVFANAPDLQAGALRLLAFSVVAMLLLWAARARRMPSHLAVAAVIAVASLDSWSIDRRFYNWSPRASTLFADDAVTTHLRAVPKPYRVLDPGGVYGYSLLMAYEIPVADGYHGFQLRAYNELAGQQEGFRNLLTSNLMDLLAIRYLVLPDTQSVPGFHEVVPPTPTAFGTTAVLYERDRTPPWARVMPTGAKVPEDQQVPTLIDARFPVRDVALLPDSATPTAPVASAPPFPTATATARVSAWQPGALRIDVSGAEKAASFLVVAENWYPDWRATVDGKTARVRRVDHSLIGVELPAGATSVDLRFDSATYRRGKQISLVGLIAAALLLLVPLVRRPTLVTAGKQP
jgi:hypothetical protein